MTDRTELQNPLRYAGLAQRVMKQQAALSLRVAAVFIIAILILPLFNFFQPKLAATQVFGFSLSWLFLGIGFFPITWILSAYFVRESDRIEAAAGQSRLDAEDADSLGAGRPAPAPDKTEGR